MEFKCANCLKSHARPKLLSCFHVFCEDCLSQRITKDHDGCSSLTCPICHLASFVSGDDVSDLPTVETNHCQEHESSELTLYCEACQRAICSECEAGKHRDHTCHQISEVYLAHRGEVEATIVPLNEKLVSTNKLLAQVEFQISAICTKEGLVESSIVNMTSIIGEALQSRRNELSNEFHVATHNKLECLSLQKQKLTTVQAQLSSCLGFIKESFRLCSKEEVVLMKNTVLKQVEILLSEKVKLDEKDPNGQFYLKLEASPQDFIEKCLEFGKIISNGNLRDSSPVKQCTPAKKFSHNPELSKMLVQRLGTPLLTLENLEGPCGVAVNEDGEVMVAEGCADRISVFSQNGKKLRSFGKCGTGMGEFSCPCELDIDGEGNILVVDGSNRRIQKFTSNGKFLASVGESGFGVLQFSEPDGIAVHPTNGMIYVVDNNTHRIQILNPDLSFSKMFGKEGSGKGYLHYPWGVACSCEGEVYVTDSGNCCIQVFSSDGQFLREFGEMGVDDGELRWPTGISVSADGCIVYVSDYGNHRVSVFSSEGLFLKSIGKKGKHCGEFGNIRGVNVDRNGLVYVCDTDNNRVVLY